MDDMSLISIAVICYTVYCIVDRYLDYKEKGDNK